MRDLPVRTATAIVYGAVFLAAGLITGPWLTLVVAILFVLGAIELRQLTRRLGQPLRTTAFLAGLAILAVGLLSLLYLTSYAVIAFDPPSPAPRASWVVPHPWVYMALLPTWAADIVAYAVGSLIGRHRLAPRISPGKTWEGTIAGFFAAALAAWLVGTELFSPALPSDLNAFLALAIGPAALAGDLLESGLKRAAGAKDSGTIFPGHGGVLDRIDSLLAVSPVVALALMVYRSGMMDR